MNNAWKQYASDFSILSDEEIARETEDARDRVVEDESWLEAVASWEAAGKPRAHLQQEQPPC
jgi:hypothetical protein